MTLQHDMVVQHLHASIIFATALKFDRADTRIENHDRKESLSMQKHCGTFVNIWFWSISRQIGPLFSIDWIIALAVGKDEDKKGKKKKGKGADGEEDLDALLAEFGVDTEAATGVL